MVFLHAISPAQIESMRDVLPQSKPCCDLRRPGRAAAPAREPKPTTPAKRVKPDARASPPAVGAVTHARSISQFTRSSALPVELAHDGSDFATAKKPSQRLILLDEGGRPHNISGLTGTQWAPTSRHGRV